MRALLSPRDLPIAELTAMRLDGDLVAVGTCFAPLDDLPDAAQHAASLRDIADGRLVAERCTAAWVWGGLFQPPTPIQLCTGHGARFARAPSLGMVVREVVIAADEVVVLEGAAITSPARTAADLVRFTPDWGADETELTRRVLENTGTSRGEVEIALDRYKLTYRRRALTRLALVSPN